MSSKYRSRNALIKAIVAAFLMFTGIRMMVASEKIAFKQRRAYTEGLAIVHENVGVETINPDLDGELIHLTGIVEPDPQVSDPIFGVGTTGDHYLMIQRKVEMYQWIEQQSTERNSDPGGSINTTTAYSYIKEWKNHSVASNSFLEVDGHENPEEMLYANEAFVAGGIRIGAFLPPDEVFSEIEWSWESLPESALVGTDSIPDESTGSAATLFSGGFYYFGTGTPQAPAIGDTRVWFHAVPSQVVSIVAQQQQTESGGGLLSAYASESTGGGTVLLVEAGEHGAAEMFELAMEEVTQFNQVFRYTGIFLVTFGLLWLAKQLWTLKDHITVLCGFVARTVTRSRPDKKRGQQAAIPDHGCDPLSQNV